MQTVIGNRQSAIGNRRAAVLLAALVALAACSGEKAEIDAELAADLQLATAQQPAVPQLNDGPVDAPAPKAEAPKPRVETPKPRPQSPRPRAPSPRPRVEPQQPVRVVEVPRTQPEPIREAEQQSSAPSRFRGIGNGTSFGLSTGAQVCTNSLPGDKIVATVSSAIVGDDGAVIPAGSSVVLEIASVTPGDSPESASIVLRPRAVVVNGESHALPGTVAIESGLTRGPQQANNSDKKKVIGGAIAGAVIGQVIGRDTRSTVIGAAAGAAAGTGAAMATRKYHACLPAGSSVRVTTSQPIVL